MMRIEDLVRDSLRQRAEDVEAAPALWREVDRRIARRRRSLVTSWSLAGVAAVLAALVVIPALVEDGGPGTLEIEPVGPRLPGVVPTITVVVDDGDLALVDLEDGTRTRLDVLGDGPVAQLVVRPGSTLEDYDLAVVQTPDDGGAKLTLVHGRGDGRGGVEVVSSADDQTDPRFVPTIRWSPTGEHVAYTQPDDDGGARLLVEPAPEPGGHSEVSDEAAGSLRPDLASELGTLGPGDVLMDWLGTTAQPGDTSLLLIRRADGSIASVEAEVDDPDLAIFSSHAYDQPTRVEGTVALAASHRSSDVAVSPLYALAPGSDGTPSLYWIDGGSSATDEARIVEVPLAGVVGDIDLGALWLDAEQDAALIGDGQRVWLFAHDGSGDFAPAVEVVSGSSLAALFDAERPDAGIPTPDGDPTEPEASDPVTDPTTDPATGPHPGTDLDRGQGSDPASDAGGGTVGGGAVLPAPIVTVSATQLTLVSGGDRQTLMTLGAEGESRFVSARVRPGSTIEDLTVVALTTAEGMWDLWFLRVADGQVTREPFGGPYAPGVGSPAGEGVAVFGPVWSPDGAHLAWFEFGTGPATLRTVGWDDGPGTGDTATDNALFTLTGLPNQPLRPMEWVEVLGTPGLTRIHGTLVDFAEGWVAVPLEIQGDGAVAQPAGESGVVVEPAPGEASQAATVAAIAAAPGRPEIGFMVRSASDGAELVVDPYDDPRRVPLPPKILPGDGPAEYWVRPLGDGALVGSPNTSLAWFAAADGTLDRLPGEVVDADVVD